MKRLKGFSELIFTFKGTVQRGFHVKNVGNYFKILEIGKNSEKVCCGQVLF